MEGASRNPEVLRETTGRVHALRSGKPSRQPSGGSFLQPSIATIRIVPGPRIVALSVHSK
jgi:hypothetical protein